MRPTHWMRKLAVSAALTVALSLAATPVQAAVPYTGYTYDGWGEETWSPAAYAPAGVVTGEGLGIGPFSAPEDLYVTADNRIFVADTGNNRIVELDGQYRFVRSYDKFDNGGKEDTFNKPQGVFVTQAGAIYVADTGNHRVVRLDEGGKAGLIIAAPKSEFFAADFVFDPKKVAVDSANRVYVIADHVFDGIMQFDSQGAFESYFAANRVKYGVADYVWKKYLSTEAQKERMISFVPTEYTNMDLDSQGFVFTTTADNSGASPKPIQRHNPTGTDVLIRQGFANPSGDLQYNPAKGPSRLVDIDVGPDGTYSALDNKRGRIFTYSSEGKLLYIFGAIGDRVGTLQEPAALEHVGEDILVLDKHDLRFTIYRPTPFGKLVNEAVHNDYIGNQSKAAELWKQVLELDTNLNIAYIGVSKAMLRQGHHEAAVKDAKLGLDRFAYSKAYQRYRKDVLKEHFNTILTSILGLAVLWAAWSQYRKFKRRKGGMSDVEGAS